GRMVAPVVGEPLPQFGVRTSYIDEAGLIWDLHTETATVAPSLGIANRFFTQAECSGPAYVNFVQPRRVFTILNLPGTWVRRDDARGGVVLFFPFDAGGA